MKAPVVALIETVPTVGCVATEYVSDSPCGSLAETVPVAEELEIPSTFTAKDVD